MGNTVTPLGPISKLIDGTTGGVLALIDAEGNEIDFSGSLADASVYAGDSQFGGYWNGTSDDSAAIQAAVTYAATFLPRKNVMLPPAVCIKSSIFVPARVHILGYNYSPGRINTAIYPHASMSLSTGFMFNMNTTDGTAPTSSPALGQWWECGIFGVWLSNASPNVAGARLALFCGTFIAYDIRAYHQTQVFKKLSGEYIDNIEIGRVNVGASYDNSEYAIEIPTGGGDVLRISNCNFPTGTGTPELGIFLTATGQSYIHNIINGTIKLSKTTNATVSKFHGEFAQLIVSDGYMVKLSDSEFKIHNADSYYPVDCSVTLGNGYTCTLVLDDVTFVYGQVSYNSRLVNAEVRTTYQTNIVCRNAVRRISRAGAQHVVQGIRIWKSDDTEFTAWTAASHYLSVNGLWGANLAAGSHYATLVGDYTGLATSATLDTTYGASSLANATTYYYTSQLRIDSGTGRNQTNAELSKLTTAANQAIGVAVTMGSSSSTCIIRVYRGIAAGNYTFYADIPVIGGCRYIVDDGYTCNGVPWTARAGPGVDAITVTTGTWLVTPGGKVAVT